MALRNEDLLLFQFKSWFPLFESCSIRGLDIPLPRDAVRYLLDDRLFVADDNVAIPAPAQLDERYLTADDYRRSGWSTNPTPSTTTTTSTTDSDSEHGQDEGEEEDDEGEPVVHFPELETALRSAIVQLGGSVVPKSNFSCPMDATWITATQTLKCEHPDEILLLLKSSDRAALDLAGDTFAACEPGAAPASYTPSIVLKEWYDLRPEREFRCFVHNAVVVGISQRDMQQHYPQLQTEKRTLRSTLLRFCRETVIPTFPLGSFCVDVYVTPRFAVKILDFNPWRGFGSTLLFDTWQDLEAAAAELQLQVAGGDPDGNVDTTLPELRLTPPEAAMVPGKRVLYGVPFDLVGADVEVGDMIRQLQQQTVGGGGPGGGSAGSGAR